jgi:hypothetical protein
VEAGHVVGSVEGRRGKGERYEIGHESAENDILLGGVKENGFEGRNGGTIVRCQYRGQTS